MYDYLLSTAATPGGRSFETATKIEIKKLSFDKFIQLIEKMSINGAGFSDPYCMLGIVSSTRESEDTGNDTTADRTVGCGGGAPGIKTAVDRIPARFIKTTSVKENTLSPVWNEKFRLYVCPYEFTN